MKPQKDDSEDEYYDDDDDDSEPEPVKEKEKEKENEKAGTDSEDDQSVESDKDYDTSSEEEDDDDSDDLVESDDEPEKPEGVEAKEVVPEKADKQKRAPRSNKQELMKARAKRVDFKIDVERQIEERRPGTHKMLNVVAPGDRRTTNRISRAEMARIIAVRAKAIEDGAPVFVDVTDLTDPIAMATRELMLRRCPLTLRRHITDTEVEDWPLDDPIMIFPVGTSQST